MNAGRDAYRRLAREMADLGAPRVLVCDERHEKAAERARAKVRRSAAAPLEAAARRDRDRLKRRAARLERLRRRHLRARQRHAQDEPAPEGA